MEKRKEETPVTNDSEEAMVSLIPCPIFFRVLQGKQSNERPKDEWVTES